MLRAEYIAANLGAVRTLVQGIDFNCNSTICYGIGSANHELFRQLQTTLNTYARLGISVYRSPLTVDGFLGDQTLVAARIAAEVALQPVPTSKMELATNAAILNDGLQEFLGQPITPVPTTAITPPEVESVVQQIVTACRASHTNPACVHAKQMCRSVRGTPQAKLDEISQICNAVRVPSWVWLTAGGIGLTAIIGIGIAARRRRTTTLGWEKYPKR